MSRLKTYRSVRVSDRFALVGAALLVSGALLSVPPWQGTSWQTVSSGPATSQPQAVVVTQAEGSRESANDRQRFNISQFLFRRR